MTFDEWWRSYNPGCELPADRQMAESMWSILQYTRLKEKREAVAAERERCALVADHAAAAVLGHANHGYGECPWELARDIARGIREGGAS